MCVVGILNRVAEVRPDGTWRVNNLPAGIGLVRARFTCVQDGVTRTGTSKFFAINANTITGFESTFTLDDADPVPERISLSADPSTLTEPGQTTQIVVIATLPDGQQVDVSLGDQGTTYITSNPAVATVSPDGLVTAVDNGRALISALNENILGGIFIQVSFVGDSDGDGIPNDIEIAKGLDPDNAADALEDVDADGLNAIEECERGTLIFVADTDGDGVDDGDEVADGTDPLDADSARYAGRLVDLQVEPSFVTLRTNAILPQEVSRQLRVTGTLPDERVVDVTSTATGTTYASSNLTIVNFGGPDGRLFAGNPGSATVTVRSGALQVDVPVDVTLFNPRGLGFVQIPGGQPNNVDAVGDHAYVAAGAGGLVVVDVSTPNAPVVAATLNTPGNGNDVRVSGNCAYLADGTSGLAIIDIQDPQNPSLLGSVDTPGVANDVAVCGTYAFVADGTFGLQVVDATNPANPVIVGSVETPGNAFGIDVDPLRHLAFLADRSRGLQIIDVSVPTAPQIISNLDTVDAFDVYFANNIAYVADGNATGNPGGLVAIDTSNPFVPVLTAQSPPPGFYTDVVTSTGLALCADVISVNSVHTFNITNPQTPVPSLLIDFFASSGRDDNGTGIDAETGFVYMTGTTGISDHGCCNNGRLHVGQFFELTDDLGVPPTVEILTPGEGDELVEGQAFNVEVDAQDDVLVAAVQFLVNGELVATDTAAPYVAMLTAPEPGPLNIAARAVDIGNNISETVSVTVNVIPDPLTTVVGVVNGPCGPLPDATVTTFNGLQDVTDPNGEFVIVGVPTILGDIEVEVVALINGRTVRGTSDAFPPVRGGLTDVGVIEVGTGALRGDISLLIVGADSTSVFPRNEMLATGFFTEVNTFDSRGGTPTVDFLLQHDVVLNYTNFVPNNRTLLGDRLADYVDGGGQLVICTYSFSNPWSVLGRITTTGYSPLVNTGQNGTPGLLNVTAPDDPIFEGINVGAITFFRNSNFARPALDAGATLLAQDTSGRPMMARNADGTVTGLNLFPQGGNFGGNNAEFYRLIANTLRFSGGGFDEVDCQPNGRADICDIAEGTSEDIIGDDGQPDGVPDECQSDCNGNLIPDDVDITNGAPDVVGAGGLPDGIPDECQSDCNGNLIPDDLDIDGGAPDLIGTGGQPDGIPDECQSDCNGNFVPDDEDIANGTSDDGNLNGVPDECETTVVGLVLDPLGNPVANADVETDGVRGVTEPDGTFSLPGVRADQGDIVVDASALIDGQLHTGQSDPTPPVPGGVTDVGPITLSADVALSLYSISPRDALLREIDPLTGQTIFALPVLVDGEVPIQGGNGLATHPRTLELYALLNLGGPSRRLGVIDPRTGFANVIGDTGDSFAGLAFDGDGILYGVTGDGAAQPESLFTLSTLDASPTLILPLGNGDDGETIAFNPADGRLYHASGIGLRNDPNGTILEAISLDTLTVTAIPLSGIEYSEAGAMVFWTELQTFLLGDVGANGFFRVSPAGAVQPVGVLDHTSKGLAFAPRVGRE